MEIVSIDNPQTPVPFIKKKLVLFLIIFLILFIPLFLYFYKINFGNNKESSRTLENISSPNETTIVENIPISCEELAKSRTEGRKTGTITFENRDKSTSSAQIFLLGEKYITTYSDIGPDIYTRAGKVLEIKDEEQIITLDVGENHKMKGKTLKLRIIKSLIKYGQKTDDTYIKNVGYCALEKDDLVEFSVDKKDAKNYKSVVTANMMTLVQ